MGITRREFIKEAIKQTIPFLGIIVLAPSLLSACSKDDEPLGCKNSCTGTAQAGCGTSCSSSCVGTAQNGCGSGCSNTCKEGCNEECNNTAKSSSCSDCSVSCTNGCKDNCGNNCKDSATSSSCSGCGNSCNQGCAQNCDTTCRTGCNISCLNTCDKSCQGNCNVSCLGGCAWCQGENYDAAETATIYQRSTAICKMHKARVHANNYYWNKLFPRLERERMNENQR